MEAPETLQKAIAYFADPDNAFQAAVEFRWPGGNVTCPRCGGAKHSFVKTRKLWFCYVCKKQFTVKVGTVMEDSPIGLDKWMTAIWMLANCKNGISSYEIARNLGIHQKSAWFMLHRIREALSDETLAKLGGDSGPIEIDETFVGGKVKNMHKNRRPKDASQGGKGKAVVLGMLERGGRVRAKVVKDRSKVNIAPAMKENIQQGAHIITDEFASYPFVAANNYVHEVINHAIEYVNGHIHTNGIENFWSLLKRGLNGTYVSVEPFHLQSYVAEQVFRFNNRATKDNKLTDSDRWALVMSQVAGKRLTYAQLTGKGTDTVC